MIKLLVIVDSAVENLDEIADALKGQSELYEKYGGVAIEHTFERQDLSAVLWIEYNPGSGYYGADYGWVAQNTKKDPKYMSIAFVFNETNWSKQGNNDSIWGWHIGKYNNAQIQLIRFQKNLTTYPADLGRVVNKVFFAFYMELMHAWNDYIKTNLGVNITPDFGVTDYDEEVVHGTTPPWVRYRYIPVLEKLKPYFLTLFKSTIMYDLSRNPYQTSEIFAVAKNKSVKHHITGKFTLVEGKGDLWDYKVENGIIRVDAMYPLSEWDAIPEGREIALLVQDSAIQ